MGLLSKSCRMSDVKFQSCKRIARSLIFLAKHFDERDLRTLNVWLQDTSSSVYPKQLGEWSSPSYSLYLFILSMTQFTTFVLENI